MDPSLAYFLIVVSLAIMAGELLLPASGMLFGLGLTGIIVALAILFHADLMQGVVTFLVVTVLLTMLGPLALRLWQASPLGRRLTLEALPAEAATAQDKALEALRFRCGKTASPLRPAGVTDFDGRRVDTLSEGPFVEAGCWVRCIAIRDGHVIVRPLDAPPDLMELSPDEMKF